MTVQCMTHVLQDDIKTIMTAFKALMREVEEIEDAYNKTDIQTALPSEGTDPATENTKLTKSQYVNGITFCTKIADFFGNVDVGSATDYMSTIQQLQYGNVAVPTKRSEATEAIGDRMYQVALDCLELYKQCKNANKTYLSNEISDMVSNFDSDRTIWGAEMTKADLNAAVTLMEQWVKFLGNQTVTSPADYAATVFIWEKLIT